VRAKYESSKIEIKKLVETFYQKGYKQGAAYLEKLSDRIFTKIELWPKTGVLAPKEHPCWKGYVEKLVVGGKK
jgi:hypothetical protein